MTTMDGSSSETTRWRKFLRPEAPSTPTRSHSASSFLKRTFSLVLGSPCSWWEHQEAKRLSGRSPFDLPPVAPKALDFCTDVPLSMCPEPLPEPETAATPQQVVAVTVKPVIPTDFKALKLDELKALCASHNIAANSFTRKAQYVSALEQWAGGVTVAASPRHEGAVASSPHRSATPVQSSTQPESARKQRSATPKKVESAEKPKRMSTDKSTPKSESRTAAKRQREQAPPVAATDYSTLRIDELKALCDTRGIIAKSGWKKNHYVAALKKQ